jgi:iron complex outermembrane receptor protein
MKRIILLLGGLVPVLAFSQFKGRVINERNEGVPFASVTVKNSTIGVNTDSVGYFSFAAPDKFPFTLVVTSVGFRKNELVIRDNEKNNVLIVLDALFQVDTVVITSRRRREVLQDVPIPISVIGGKQLDEAGAFNVNRVKEFVPSVQLYTSNPRNTGINIRGLVHHSALQMMVLTRE